MPKSPLFRSPTGFLALLLQLPRIIVKERINTIVAFNSSISSAIVFFIGKIFRKRTILNTWGYFEPPILWDRIGYDLTLLFTDKNIVNSKDLLPRTIKHSFLPQRYIETKKWIFVPNGINTNLWTHPKEAEIYDIAFLGNMQHKARIIAKGFTYFAKACQIVYGDNGDKTKKVVVIGQTDVHLLKQICGNFNEVYFDFLGRFSAKEGIVHYLPQEKVIEKLCQAKIFVLSSTNEGMPNALMEAMALGRPCIATRVGAVPDLIEDGKSGIIVPPNDSQAIAEAIKRLLSNEKLRADLGSAARKRMQDRFSWKRALRENEHFLKD